LHVPEAGGTAHTSQGLFVRRPPITGIPLQFIGFEEFAKAMLLVAPESHGLRLDGRHFSSSTVSLIPVA
jgi:hypothetical protein